MKAFVLCVAIQIVAQTNAGSMAIGRKLADLLGWRGIFDKEWIKYDNFCVSQFNEELLSSPMPAGNTNIEACQKICDSYESIDYCTAIEWYDNGWNDVNCYLILDDIPAKQGSDGPRRGDATCHVKADCLSNKDCPGDKPICAGVNGGKCILNGQSPNAQGCWIRFPSGCPNQKNKSKYKNLQDARIWNRETYNGASNSRDKCSARRGPINNWCGVSNVITHYVSEPCQPRDSDICLKKAWKDDDWTLGCKKTFEYESDWCDTWAKDMRRCCPESCKSGTFRKDDCVILSPCHTNGCDGCYHPKYDVCLRFGNRFRELIFKNEEDCTSKGGINCRGNSTC